MGVLSRARMFVFDMAGTTVNEKGLVYRTLKDTFKEFNIRISDEDFVRFYGMEKKQVISDVVDMVPIINQENKEKIYQKFKVNLTENYKIEGNIEPMKGSFELFKLLRDRGIKVCLNTGFDKEMANFVIDKVNFRNNIDSFISSSEVSKGRPQPFMINSLMKKYDIESPKQVVKVGDTTLDVLEGKNASTLYQFSVLTGEESKESLLKSNPTHMFEDLEKLKKFLEEDDKQLHTSWGYN